MADMRLSFEEASVHFRLATAVTELAEILRHSYWARGSQIADLLPMVQQLSREMADDPRTTELARLVKRAAELAQGVRPVLAP
jgi:hypothetical protein